MKGASELEVVALGVAGIGCVNAQNESRPGFLRMVGCATMNGQGGANGDVSHFRHLALSEGFVTRIKGFGRKHPMLKVFRRIPLRARRDFEGTHVLVDIDSRQVESK